MWLAVTSGTGKAVQYLCKRRRCINYLGYLLRMQLRDCFTRVCLGCAAEQGRRWESYIYVCFIFPWRLKENIFQNATQTHLYFFESCEHQSWQTWGQSGLINHFMIYLSIFNFPHIFPDIHTFKNYFPERNANTLFTLSMRFLYTFIHFWKRYTFLKKVLLESVYTFVKKVYPFKSV